ncbi:MAG: hypothetical protein ABI353_14355 [Isosphaeraceae bacterium]
MFDFADVLRRAWPVFLEAVRMGRTISYSELAGRTGPPCTCRQVHRQLLIPLSERCQKAGLPNLAALVVRKDSGMPGAGWYGTCHSDDPGRDWANAVDQCLNHRWPSRPDPRLLWPDGRPPRRHRGSEPGRNPPNH